MSFGTSGRAGTLSWIRQPLRHNHFTANEGDCEFQVVCLNPVTKAFTNLVPYVTARFSNSARL
jgi:hypothetical protein